MYDEDRINDSLDFVEQIRLYDTFDPEHISDGFRLDSHLADLWSLDAYDIGQTGNNIADMNDKVALVPNDNGAEEILNSSIFGDIMYIFICMAVSLAVAFCFTRFVAHHTIVDGNSMNANLEDRDCLLIEKISYYMHAPERYDIIVFPYSDDVNYIKRIIGLPGEKLQIIDGHVYINDKMLSDDTYGNAPINNPGDASSPIIIGEGEYFVLGDNRNASYDSRKADVGLIKEEDIEGKAVFRFWPFDSFGSLY